MNKLFHSIETFKKTQAEQKTNIQYHYPPNFSESLNHPYFRFLPRLPKAPPPHPSRRPLSPHSMLR